METPQKKNKKWKIFAGIVAVLALAVAVGPILVAKYMKAEYEKKVRIKTSNMMIRVKGTIQTFGDTVYLKGENAKNYILLGDQIEELKNNKGQFATVFGDMARPTMQTVDGQPVRLAIYVTKFGMPDLPAVSGGVSSEEITRLRQRADEKLEYRDSVLSKLKKMENARLEVIGGTVKRELRSVNEDLQRQYFILTDKWGDKYALRASSGFFMFPADGAEYIALGYSSVPTKNYPIKKDEVVFVVNEFYKADTMERIF